MITELVLYGLGGIVVGAIAGFADPKREHETAIIGGVVTGPLGLVALMLAYQGKLCVASGGTPGDSCPNDTYYATVAGFLPIILGIAAAVASYLAVSEQVAARASRRE